MPETNFLQSDIHVCKGGEFSYGVKTSNFYVTVCTSLFLFFSIESQNTVEDVEERSPPPPPQKKRKEQNWFVFAEKYTIWHIQFATGGMFF